MLKMDTNALVYIYKCARRRIRRFSSLTPNSVLCTVGQYIYIYIYMFICCFWLFFLGLRLNFGVLGIFDVCVLGDF